MTGGNRFGRHRADTDAGTLRYRGGAEGMQAKQLSVKTSNIMLKIRVPPHQLSFHHLVTEMCRRAASRLLPLFLGAFLLGSRLAASLNPLLFDSTGSLQTMLRRKRGPQKSPQQRWKRTRPLHTRGEEPAPLCAGRGRDRSARVETRRAAGRGREAIRKRNRWRCWKRGLRGSSRRAIIAGGWL